MSGLTEREILVELGLSKLEVEDGRKVMALFVELTELRLGKRLSHLMGPSGFDTLESETGLEDSPRALERGLSVIKESIPDYGRFVDDELRRAKADFVARLTERIARTESEQDR